MRREATAHRHRDPPPHNKYGKSQVHKTRNDLIDTISKVIYRSWLCLPLITHFGQVLFRSFPSSRVAVRVNLLLFVLKDLVRHWKCSLTASPRMLLLYSVFHTYFFFVPSHPLSALSLSLRRRCLQSLFPAHSSAHLLFQPGNTVSHKPRTTWPWTKLPSCSCPHHSTFLGVTLRRHNATVKAPPSLQEQLGLQLTPKSKGSERERGKKAETAPGRTAGIPPCPRQPLSKERTSAAGKCHVSPQKCHGDQL